MSTQVDTPFFTLKQAAAYAHCHKRTIQRWLEAGLLPRHGHNRPLIKKADLEAFLCPALAATATSTPGASE